MGGHRLSDSAMRDLARMKKLTLGESANQGEQRYEGHWKPRRIYWGKLATDMTAGSLASPSTFTFNVWVPNGSGDHPAFAVSGDSNLLAVEGANRSTMTGQTDAFIKVEFEYGEWSPIWVDCPSA